MSAIGIFLIKFTATIKKQKDLENLQPVQEGNKEKIVSIQYGQEVVQR